MHRGRAPVLANQRAREEFIFEKARSGAIYQDSLDPKREETVHQVTGGVLVRLFVRNIPQIPRRAHRVCVFVDVCTGEIFL